MNVRTLIKQLFPYLDILPNPTNDYACTLNVQFQFLKYVINILLLQFQEYITYWKTRIEQRNNCPKQEHESDTDEDTCPKSRDYLDASLLYLKDWHLIQQYPQHDVYILPVLFSEDWLNDYWDQLNLNDDYRFVYMGPKRK